MPVKTILVVDDSFLIREVIRTILEAHGFAVIEANNGRDALTKLSSNPLALVITDYNMPEMNGLELIRVLKHHPLQRAVPIIMLTAENRASIERRFLDAGAAICLSKPFQAHELATIVYKMTA